MYRAELDEEQVQIASATHSREKKLFDKGLISKADYEEAQQTLSLIHIYSPFCLIEKIEETHITLSHSQRLRVSKQQFLQKWTGSVLVGEVTESKMCIRDSFTL